MPPVIGPTSPAKMVLWSWAGGIITARSPSQKASTVTSWPTMNSSMTAWDCGTSKMERSADPASAWVWAMVTPFPARRPASLTTSGSGWPPAYASAVSSSAKLR